MFPVARNYTEKRDYIRMTVDCPVQYQKTDVAELCHGRCIDLSATGAKLQINRFVPIGTKIKINLVPQLKISPNLTALMEVLRVEPMTDATYYIAGRLESIAV